jgi:hypothetical protein
MYRGVVCKFCHGKPFFPIILMKVDECGKILFNGLVHAFCLSICLGMIGCGRILFSTEDCKKFFDIFRYELGVSVMDDLMGESMIAYDLIS